MPAKKTRGYRDPNTPRSKPNSALFRARAVVRSLKATLRQAERRVLKLQGQARK